MNELNIDELEKLADLMTHAPVGDQVFQPHVFLEIIQRLRLAEQDAARYRWLRNRPYFAEEECLIVPEKLDAAIDVEREKP